VRCPTRSLSLALVITLAAGTATGQEVGPELLGALSYRFIGPDGNRAIAVVGVPGDDKVIYAGAASGGIWKPRWVRWPSRGATPTSSGRGRARPS